MKKVVITEYRKAKLKEVPDLKPKDDWVVVKIYSAPMCTEYKDFIEENPKSEFLGHEAAGEVVAVAQPGKVKVGDRVAVMPTTPCGLCPLCVAGDYIYCTNKVKLKDVFGINEGHATMAQYLVKPSWLLPKIPDEVSYDHGALSCCALGPSYGAFDTMNLEATDTVLITGAGPVGLGAVVNAKYLGARVIMSEISQERSTKAKELGADEIVNPNDKNCLEQIKDLTRGAGVDMSLDCSGAVPAHRLCIDATRVLGQVTCVGQCLQETPIVVSNDLISKGLTVRGSWHYNLKLFPQIMQVIENYPLIVKLISHVFPMSRIQEAFETSASNTSGKIILRPWE